MFITVDTGTELLHCWLNRSGIFAVFKKYLKPLLNTVGHSFYKINYCFSVPIIQEFYM
jgi:hypothetical protein